MSEAAGAARERRRMVETQIAARGVRDPRVLAALERVPRERFVPEELRARAYADGPLPIGASQTISQPYVVAAMIELLDLGPDARALEIGVGSGYAAAVLGELAAEVYGVERVASLAAEASERLAALGYAHVHVRHGDGTLGWPEHAPYDGILVSAGAAGIPPALTAQLAVGGRLVIPLGPAQGVQTLTRVTREDGEALRTEHFEAVRFVPLLASEA